METNTVNGKLISQYRKFAQPQISDNILWVVDVFFWIFNINRNVDFILDFFKILTQIVTCFRIMHASPCMLHMLHFQMFIFSRLNLFYFIVSIKFGNIQWKWSKDRITSLLIELQWNILTNNLYFDHLVDVWLQSILPFVSINCFFLLCDYLKISIEL